MAALSPIMTYPQREQKCEKNNERASVNAKLNTVVAFRILFGSRKEWFENLYYK